jgi:uncharacterized BrkB/YihY/UPF0761 family membrane protein
VGLVVHDPATLAKIQRLVIDVFPGDAQPQLLKALEGVKRGAGWMGIISVAGLVWTGTGLFASMEFVLTQVFGTKQRDTVRQRAMGLVMMVLFVLAVMVTVIANSAAAFLPFMPVTGFIIGAAVMIALLIAIYRFVPNRTFALQEILPGALLAGVLIQILTLAFPIYSRVSHGFNTYGQQFALFFLLTTWLYFLSQLLLLGAVFNRMRLGKPATEGLVAAPAGESKSTPRPVEAIKDQKAEGAPEPVAAHEARRENKPRGPAKPGLVGRAVGYVLVAVTFLRSLVSRTRTRRRHLA